MLPHRAKALQTVLIHRSRQQHHTQQDRYHGDKRTHRSLNPLLMSLERQPEVSSKLEGFLETRFVPHVCAIFP